MTKQNFCPLINCNKKHKIVYFRFVDGAARTYLATLAGMHAVVETGGLVPANAAQHRCAIEFCKEKMPN